MASLSRITSFSAACFSLIRLFLSSWVDNNSDRNSFVSVLAAISDSSASDEDRLKISTSLLNFSNSSAVIAVVVLVDVTGTVMEVDDLTCAISACASDNAILELSNFLSNSLIFSSNFHFSPWCFSIICFFNLAWASIVDSNSTNCFVKLLFVIAAACNLRYISLSSNDLSFLSNSAILICIFSTSITLAPPLPVDCWSDCIAIECNAFDADSKLSFNLSTASFSWFNIFLV